MATADEMRSMRGDVWRLKGIGWPPDAPRDLKIITQNLNGPCSLISLCNILILRGDIAIEPESRTSVSYEYLAQLLADKLVTDQTDPALSAALSTLPNTQRGLDLNPLFTGVHQFRPAGAGGELKLFELAGIKLVHGWLIDPESSEHAAVARVADYDSALNTIVEADYLTKGQLTTDDANADLSALDRLSPEQRQKIQDALAVRHFIDLTSSQLTYYGLFTLASELEPGALVALFRSSHLAVLYKARAPDEGLYSLVTDAIFANEPSVVWERMEDVEGGASTFVDSELKHSSPAGGDFAGTTAENALRAIEERQEDEATRADAVLARQLQEEEDAQAQAAYEEHQRRRMEQQQQVVPRAQPKKKDCTIM